MSYRYRTILSTLVDKLQNLINAFKTRVATDSGTLEGEAFIKPLLQSISGVLTSLVLLTPNAWKTSILYTILQNNGSTDFGFVRATSATRVREDGLIESVGNNIPRLDWLNGYPQILIEPQATNLLLRSEEFDNAYWLKTRGNITPNLMTAPNGSLTADAFYGDTTSGQHSVRINFPYVSGNTYTASIFVKKGVKATFEIVMSFTAFGGAWRRAIFNLDTGTLVGYNTNSGVVPKIVEFLNGWYLCSFTNICTTSISDDLFFTDLFTANIGTTDLYFYLWGAQLELGTTASTYIPTTTATVTRNADIATLAPPVGTTEIIETVNGVDNTITTIPTTYQIPNGRIDKILMK